MIIDSDDSCGVAVRPMVASGCSSVMAASNFLADPE